MTTSLHFPQISNRSAAPQTFWEQIAEKRWGRYITNVERGVLHRAHEMFAQPGTFLEVGCDGGRWSESLVARGWKAICIDVSEKAIETCQKRLPNAKCLLVSQSDTTLPCEASSIDIILCLEVPILPTSWFKREAGRVLRNNGVLMGVFNNKLSIRGAVRHACDSLLGKEGWYGSSYPAWRRELAREGLDPIHEQGICWFPFRRDSDSVLVPFCTAVERSLGLRRLASVSPWVVFLAKKNRQRH